MKHHIKNISFVLALALVLCAFSVLVPNVAFAEEGETVAAATNIVKSKAYAAALAITVVGAFASVGMSLVISKSADGIARQPEADGKIRTAMMLGLVFIETVVIYALIVSILVIFVL